MLVSPDWLAERLDAVTVLDASWHMPDAGRDAAAEFATAHIPGALRFDIDEVADPASHLPHTLPSPADFSRLVGAMGISNDTTVVIYEAGPLFAAARAWWMFRVMGHEAHILDGGLARWQAEGHPVDGGPAATPTPATFTARFRRELFADSRDVADALTQGGTVADARASGRFAGKEPEPRPGVRAGHMPGARNVPYRSLIDGDGRLRDDAALRTAFEEAGVPLTKPVITTCGSGVTAAILSLALDRLGTPSALYDGSWSEWGADGEKPVQTGSAAPVR